MNRTSNRRYRQQYCLVASLLAFVQGIPDALSAEEDLQVTVQPGDSLSKITWGVTGIETRSIWLEVAAYNELDPDSPLIVGSTILIPPRLLAQRSATPTGIDQPSAEIVFTESNVNNKSQPDQKPPIVEAEVAAPAEKPRQTAPVEQDLQVTVQPGDSLSKITWGVTGIETRSVWLEVAAYNKLDPDSPLIVGSTILIPPRLLTQRSTTPTEITWSEQTKKNASNKTNTSDAQSQSIDPTPCIPPLKCIEEPEPTSIQSNTTTESVNDESKTDSTTAVAPIRNTVDDNIDQSPADTASTDPDISNKPQPDQKPPIVEAEVAAPFEKPQQTAEVEQPEQSAPVGQEPEITQAPAATPGLFNIDEDAATRALERSLIQLNALLLNRGSAEISVDYTYAYDTTMEPILVSAISEDDLAESTAAIAILENRNSQHSLTLGIKYGLPRDSQISLTLPFEVIESDTVARVDGISIDSDTQSLQSIGDYTIGFTKALLYEKGLRPDVLLNVSFDGDSGSESGSESDSLVTGSGSNEYSIGVNLTKRQDPLVFTLSASHSISTEDDDDFTAGSVTRLAAGTLLAASPFTSLQLEFDQIFIAEAEFDGESLADTNTSIGSFSIGASSVLSKRLFLSTGVRFGLTEATSDYQFSLGLSLRLE